MNEKLSALMDGELDRDTADTVIKSLGDDVEQQSHWDCYHLIGDLMRGENEGEFLHSRDSTRAIFSKIAAEPTVLAPGAIKKPVGMQNKTRIALAMAASLVTVSAIGIVAFKQQTSTAAGVQLVQQIAPQPVSAGQSPGQVNTQVNDYLAIHRQFANPSGLQAAALRNAEAPASLRSMK